MSVILGTITVTSESYAATFAEVCVEQIGARTTPTAPTRNLRRTGGSLILLPNRYTNILFEMSAR